MIQKKKPRYKFSKKKLDWAPVFSLETGLLKRQLTILKIYTIKELKIKKY